MDGAAAAEVEVDAGTTVLVDGVGAKDRIQARVDELRVAINETASDYDRETTDERVKNLLQGVAGGEASLLASTQQLEPFWVANLALRA